MRRDVTSETKTLAKAFKKFYFLRIRIMMVRLNSCSSEEIESSWSLNLFRSDNMVKVLFCLCLLNGFT